MKYVKCCKCGVFIPEAGRGEELEYFEIKVVHYNPYNPFAVPVRELYYCPECMKVVFKEQYSD